MKKNKFITAKEAAGLIRDGSSVVVDGFIGFCLADDILGEIEERFISEGSPRALKLINVAGIGGDGVKRGINHFAHEGMLRRLICSNLSLAPKPYPLIIGDKIPTYMLPQGVISHLMRAIAGHKPGVLTSVGLKTFVDPRNDGGAMNPSAKNARGTESDIAYDVQLMEIGGEEYLFYPSLNVDVAIIKGSMADEEGNISIEKEAIHIEQMEVAAAARNSGGIVMVQVDQVVKSGEIHPQRVDVPSTLVDYVIVGKPENTGQHFIGDCKPVPSWCGEERIELENLKPVEFGLRKIICRRGALEIEEGDFLNLGIGVPMDVTGVLNEERMTDQVTSSSESGVIGGVQVPGFGTGAAYNPVAILKQPDIFDFYDGGGIDFTGLGAAQIDARGNVNVSKFAGNVTGPGGFINISQGAKKVCFMGTFTAGKSDIRIEDGRLNIVTDGPHMKFVRRVEHITFSGEYSIEKTERARKNGKNGQRVLYITERAVFELTKDGLCLIEIAPGVDLERDILGKMEFKPVIAKELKEMDKRLFLPEKMGIAKKKTKW